MDARHEGSTGTTTGLRPLSGATTRIRYPGSWSLIDRKATVFIDGVEVGTGSRKRGFDFGCETSIGLHALTIDGPNKRRMPIDLPEGESVVHLKFDRVGNSGWSAHIETAQGHPIAAGWRRDAFGDYLCSACGTTTPHEVRVRAWWTALFGRVDASFVSGLFPWAVVVILAAFSMGILGVLVLFFLRPFLQLASFAVGEAVFPTPRRCVICKAPATLAEARRALTDARVNVDAAKPTPGNFCVRCGHRHPQDFGALGPCSNCGGLDYELRLPRAPTPNSSRMSAAAHEAARSDGTGQPRFAGFWRRVGAFLIDAVLLAIPLFVGTALVPQMAGPLLTPGNVAATRGEGAVGLFALVVMWLYFAVLESSRHQATLGKLALGLRVTDLVGSPISFGRASGRFFGKWLSVLPLYLGFVMAGFTARKQTLHDIVAGTLVLLRTEKNAVTRRPSPLAGAGTFGQSSATAPGESTEKASVDRSDTTSWRTRENAQFGFEFRYPEGWENVPGIPSIVYHPPDAESFVALNAGKAENVFSPVITLVMMPRGDTAGQTPAQVFEGFKRLLPKVFAGYTCLSERETRLASGQDVWELSFTFQKAERPFRSVLIYAVRPNAIFVFDGSSLGAHFVRHERILRESLASLRVK